MGLKQTAKNRAKAFRKGKSWNEKFAKSKKEAGTGFQPKKTIKPTEKK